MSDKVEATFHGRGCPWCGAGQYVAGNGYYRCGACRRHGKLPTPVYTNEGGDFLGPRRYKMAPTRQLPRWRKVYLRSLLTTLVISLWFFCWLFLLGNWGYAVAIPTTALYFACEEMTW